MESDGVSGSTFTVQMPVCKGTVLELTNGTNEIKTELSKQNNILIFTDKPSTKNTLEFCLRDQNATTISTFNQEHNVALELEKTLRNSIVSTDSSTVSSFDLVVVEFDLLDMLRLTLNKLKLSRWPHIVALTYLQKWKNLSNRENIIPLFKPLQHCKTIQFLATILHPKKEQTPKVQMPPPTRSTGENLRILVVEDSPINNKLLCNLLRSLGFETLSALNGLEGTRIVAKEHPDAVLMDIMMPVMDGITATKEIRKTNPNIPIIAATASFSQEDKDVCLQAGMNDILPKPFTKAAVISTLQKNHII